MWTSVALAALSLLPAQPGDLAMKNVRCTYGLLGPTRADRKLVPGDRFNLAFDIENAHADPTGKILYSMGMEVTNASGKTVFKEDPREAEAMNTLGGTSFPAFAHVDTPVDQEPGSYTVKVTVADRSPPARTKTIEEKFEVLPKGFGLVRLSLSLDPRPERMADTLVPAVGIPGELIWVNVYAVGFERIGEKKQPNIAMEMHILDSSGKDTLERPLTGEIKDDIPQDLQVIPLQAPIFLNRAGKFTVKVKAVDQGDKNKKAAEITFPLVVLEPS
jgi:hypothetical protein